MKGKSLIGVLWRLGIFSVVCLFFLGAMFAIFAQLRFEPQLMYRADFADVSGLEEGQFVRIAGVEVGKVTKLTLRPDTTVSVEFSTDDSVVLTRGSRAVVRYSDLVGGRYLALEEGTGSTAALKRGDTIPLANTSPSLDLDAVIGGFRPLFRALDPDQVNALASQLIGAFEGQGETISSFFSQTAALTNMLADRDQLIGQVIVNLHGVLSSLGDQNTQFAMAVDSLSQLVSTLASRKQDITDSVASSNAAAASVADLLSQSRPAIKKVVDETDRTSGIVVADHDYFDNLLATLPDAYQALSRQGLYGDFFTFYLCDVLFKVNGKGGQPVYIKIAGQASGRCTPR
ncbi:MCE family protein [Mycobacterium sp. URHB0044]|uniref:MCE family protein n=1 Tax=Mycobacterium sp. URHB0044 TaxID=1380386 RepID=UPI00048FF6B3|nr:MCE family protein [Mycobacterium sp. URHB0044]